MTFDTMATAYLEDCILQRYRTMSTARLRVGHLRGFFGGWAAETMTADSVRSYQLYRRSTVRKGSRSIARPRPLSRGLSWRSVAVARAHAVFPKRLKKMRRVPGSSNTTST
jgi:hypothetical protein